MGLQIGALGPKAHLWPKRGCVCAWWRTLLVWGKGLGGVPGTWLHSFVGGHPRSWGAAISSQSLLELGLANKQQVCSSPDTSAKFGWARPGPPW